MKSLFSSEYQTFGLGQTIWADKFWGIWGIFGHFTLPADLFGVIGYFTSKMAQGEVGV